MSTTSTHTQLLVDLELRETVVSVVISFTFFLQDNLVFITYQNKQ